MDNSFFSLKVSIDNLKKPKIFFIVKAEKSSIAF